MFLRSELPVFIKQVHFVIGWRSFWRKITFCICELVNKKMVVFHQQIGKECLTCREKVAVFNMSYFAKFYLTGPDAQKAADWIFTNNMAKPPGT